MTRSPRAKSLAPRSTVAPPPPEIAGRPYSLRAAWLRPNLVVGVGQDDPALVRFRVPIAVPAVDQIPARLLAGLGGMDHAVRAIGLQRLTDSANSEMTRGVPLPVLALAADLADLHAAVTFVDRAERRARLDGLQLLRIARQHDLGAGDRRVSEHPRQLPRPDHPSLVDHQHVADVRSSRPCPHSCSRLAMVRDESPTALQILRRDPGQRHAAHLVARPPQASRATPSMALLPVPA